MPTPYAYFQGAIVPLSEAKIGVMTHAFNYGTAVFEGIRGNWNEAQQTTQLFRLREHMERIAQSARILRLDLRESTDRLCDLAVEITERSGFSEDVYLRPMVYLSSEQLGVRLHNLDTDTLMFLTPFPAYLPETARCHTSTWRRVDDTGIPPRAKVTGIYVNSALAKTEANLNGFDEAIMLNADGHVWTDGTTHLLFEPVEFLEKLAALTPRPEINLVLYHGVLAPHAQWRAEVVAYRRAERDRTTDPRATEAGGPRPRTGRGRC